MKKKILCMGSLNIDLTMYMNSLPMPGETIVTDNFQTFPGGKGGNQAAAAVSYTHLDVYKRQKQGLGTKCR